MLNRFKRYPLIQILLLVLLSTTVAIYYSSLYYEYDLGLDDGWLVVNNPGIRDLSWRGIYFIFFEDKLDPFYYPLTYLSLAIDYHFFGLDAFWMRLHNLFLHLGSGCLVFVLSKKITEKNFVAFFTTALFLLHPIQVENVVWVNCRRQVLVEFNSLAALYAFIKFDESRGKGWYVASLLFFILALLSKFIASACILFFLFYQILLSKQRLSLTIQQLFKSVKIYTPFLLVALFVFAKNMQAAQQNTIVQSFHYTVLEHVAIFLHSFGFYIIQTIWPFKLALFYPAPSYGSVFVPEYLALSFLGFMVFACFILLILKRNYLFAFALAVYIFGIFLTADVMAVNSDLPCTLADRHFYLGSFGLFIGLSLLFEGLIKCQLLKYVMAAVMIVLMSLKTNSQLTHWKNTTAILERTTAIYPSEEFYHRLAMEYYLSGKEEKCISALRKSETLGLNIRLNNPYYFRVDLAAIYSHFHDTVNSAKAIEEAINSDLSGSSYSESCDTKEKAKMLSVELGEPFSSQNYNAYFQMRQEMINKCGRKLKEGRL